MKRNDDSAFEAMRRQVDGSNVVSRRTVLKAGTLALTATMVAGSAVAAARSADSSSGADQARNGQDTTVAVSAVTHLNFQGDARPALEFYQSVFEGELLIISNQEMGIVDNSAELDQVKFGQVVSPNGFKVMAYDVPSAQPFSRGDDSFFLSLRSNTAEEITAYWERLSVGSTVILPLEPSQWAPLYGMLKDRFGITWVVDVEAEYSPS